MRIVNKLFQVLFCVLLINTAKGQDVQLSQYYNAPLYLNPGLTGTGDNTRVGLNYRTQWRGIEKPFNSVSLWADHNIDPYNSSIGVMYFRDMQGNSRLTTNEISLLYSYSIRLSDKWAIKPGIQVGMVARDANYSSMVFGDQIGANGVIADQATADPLASGVKARVYGDVSAGAVLYNEHVWAGFSLHHINRPNQAFMEGDAVPLPMKLSLQGGYKFFLAGGPSKYKNYRNTDPEISVTPTFLYKSQGAYSQLDLGAYLTYEPLMFGVWYRGIPTSKNGTGISGTEALVFMLGGYYKGATLGYSYDYTLSGLRGSGSVHELALIFEFEAIKYKKRRGRSVPCPKFHRRYQ